MKVFRSTLSLRCVRNVTTRTVSGIQRLQGWPLRFGAVHARAVLYASAARHQGAHLIFSNTMNDAHERGFSVELNLEEGYAFSIDFNHPSAPLLLVDEPAPLGEDRGPNAVRLLAAAVGNCMSASLLHCLQRARVDVENLHTRVEASLARNERGRLRVSELKVTLQPSVRSDPHGRIQRCAELFEDFCIVAQSIRSGINVHASVIPALVDEIAD
jgi:organic hydroperoxide reductase OsmC/OhrA